ncbi:unnamed protein product [Rotaria magnacalcarata]|uniref:Uncharacterized protein n=1 Tax=Rotaria magnacalcarata TaxID=392030 RepID=A0A815G6A7_9BILA|nr:unnamed protein product [Rotaria magnacalcarata]
MEALVFKVLCNILRILWARITKRYNLSHSQSDESMPPASDERSSIYWQLPNRSKRLIYGLQENAPNTKLLYIKIFNIKVTNRRLKEHGYAFAKISLQSWGSKSLKCWGELIDVAYSSIRCQALYSTWENEAFLFRVDPCGHRLMIEFFDLYEGDNYLLGVLFIDLNEWIPVTSGDTFTSKKSFVLSENRRMINLVGSATMSIVYIDNLSNLRTEEFKDNNHQTLNGITQWQIENEDDDIQNENLESSPYRYADSSRAFIIEQASTVLWTNNLLDTSDQFEELTLIWLSDDLDYRSDHYEHIVCLRNIISHLELFFNLNDFFNYINSVNNERVIVLISGSFSSQIERISDEICEISNIYVVCTKDKISHYEDIAHTRTDIRGVFYSIDSFAVKLRQYVKEFIEIPTATKTISEGMTTRNLYCKQIKFKCFQMLTNILCHSSSPESVAKPQLIEYCRLANTFQEYGDEKQLAEFNNDYNANKSIYWYTCESFLFRLLSKATRQWDVDALLDFGFYISDLNEQLYQLQKQQFSSFNNTLRVYRGQFMNIDALGTLQNSVGGCISINTFLSTTEDYEFALRYAHSRTGLYENVLFIIDINMNDDEIKPFAHIDNLSAFPDTHEVLLTMGTIFRIDWIQRVTTVDEYTDHWNVYLTVCHNKDIITDSDHFDLMLLYLMDILCHLSSKSDIINEKMLERCRLYCQGNEVELHKIDLFENNYHSDNAIHEYTKDTFLYRILNRALRTEDMGTILDFRYFIVDLYNQLYKVQTDFDHYSFVVSEGHKLTVYRGQFMSMKELNQLKRNIGRYIIIQTFLSTTLSSDIALLYAGHESQNSLYESVLFVIDIDIQQNIRKRPLANIGKFSHMRHENEVLFSVGTIFQVKSLKKFTNRLWILHLNLYNNDNDEINEIEKYTKLVSLLVTHNQMLINSQQN